MLKQGQKAPAFSLPSSLGREVSLREFRGRTDGHAEAVLAALADLS